MALTHAREVADAIDSLAEPADHARWVIVRGAMGSGKSTLVAHVTQQLEEERGLPVVGIRGPGGDLPPYWGVVTLMNGLLEHPRLDRLHLRRFQKWADVIAAASGILPLVGPVVGTGVMLGKTLAESRDARIRSRFIRPEGVVLEVEEAFLEALRATGEHAPLVMAIDDVHHLDPPSVRALRAVAESRLPGVGGLVAVEDPSTDEEAAFFDPGALHFSDHLTSLTLSPLEPEEAVALLCSELGSRSLEPELEDTLLEACGGSPMLLRLTAAELVARGEVVVANGIASSRNPPAVEGLAIAAKRSMRRRLSRLEPLAGLYLRRASLVGSVFPARIVSRLLPPLTDDELASTIDELLLEGIVRRLPASPVTLAFSSELLWAIIRDDAEVIEQDLAQIHALISELAASDPDFGNIIDISDHQERAGRMASAATAAMDVAERHIRTISYNKALKCLDRAIRCADKAGLDELAADAAIRRVHVLWRQNRYDTALATAEQLQRLRLEKDQLAELLFEVALTLGDMGRWGEALTTAQRAYDLAQQTELAVLEVLGSNALNTAGGMGAWDVDVFRRNSSISDVRGDPVLAAQCRGLEAQADLFDGRPEHALGVLYRELEGPLGEYVRDRHILENNIGVALALLGRFGEAETSLRELLISAKHARDRFATAVASTNLSAVLLRLGEFDDAYLEGQRAGRVFRDIGSVTGHGFHNGGVALAAYELSTSGVISKRSWAALNLARKEWKPEWRVWERGALRLDLARLAILSGDTRAAVSSIIALLRDLGRYRYRLCEARRILEAGAPQEAQCIDADAARAARAAYPGLERGVFSRDPLRVNGHFIIRGWSL